jgi:glycosyltransferase involved in cell wall biosynthesis
MPAEIGNQSSIKVRTTDRTAHVPELSVVLPCLNEAETLQTCIDQILRTFREHHIQGEIIVADNGSTDGSPEIAQRCGASAIHVPERGYGAALMGGIAAARGKYILIGDADASYDFSHIPRFLEPLRTGHQLVMGNRFEGGVQPGAMPALHRYFGNPFLTELGRMFFRAPCGDFHCGLRAFSREAYDKLGLRTTGMEFASEMVVKATILKMRIAEVPTTLAPDGRSRAPHLRTWRDGWRHLRFLLLYSPRWLFLYPGLVLVVLGLAAGCWLLPGPRLVGHIVFDSNSLMFAAIAVILGCQSIAFATFTKIFAISEGLLPADARLEVVFRYITLEVGLAIGVLLLMLGLAGSFYAVGTWREQHFGPLVLSHTLRIVIPACVALTLGVQIIFSSFFLSVLGMRRR